MEIVLYRETNLLALLKGLIKTIANVFGAVGGSSQTSK